jgi:hypothetical protein
MGADVELMSHTHGKVRNEPGKDDDDEVVDRAHKMVEPCDIKAAD